MASGIGKVLFWPLAFLALAAVILELPLWQSGEIHRGPFLERTPSAQREFYAPVGAALPFGMRADNLRVWINGRELGSSSFRYEVAGSATAAGSDYVVAFSLPQGIENNAEALLTIRYSVRPRKSITALLLLAAIGLCRLVYWRVITDFLARRGEPVIRPLVRAPYIVLRIIVYLALALSAIYAATSIVALAGGWALPTTAVIRWSPIAAWMAERESGLGLVLLTGAAFGTVATWLATIVPQGTQWLQQEEMALQRLLRPAGVVIITCAFAFSVSAMWSGIAREGEIYGHSIGGLLPFNDAGGYTASAYDEAKTGAWTAVSLHRPLAAALRNVLLYLSAYSYPAMLLLQTFLLSVLCCFAASSVMRWRGVWAGVAFFGMAYIYCRVFLPSALTESLGLCWALFAVPFLIDALRTGSLPSALLALAGIALGLMSRMGAMFMIPGLVVWIGWQFGSATRRRLIAGAAALAVTVGVLGASYALAKTYRSGEDVTGANFSYTLCGLTIGTDWTGCPKQLEKEGIQLPGDEAANAKVLYAMAWRKFSAQPSVLLKRLASAAWKFVHDLTDQPFRGYGRPTVEPSLNLKYFISIVAIFGLISVAFRRRDKGELLFWALFWLSVLASSAIVFYDDGDRVLAVSYVFVWLFFASGFSCPVAIAPAGDAERRGRMLTVYGVFCLAVAAVLFAGVPWVAYRFSPARDLLTRLAGGRGEGELWNAPAGEASKFCVRGSPATNCPVAVVFGGRRMSGFLVVPDGAPLRVDVPTVSMSTFAEIVGASEIEKYQNLIHPDAPDAPFAFVFAPGLGRTISDYLYIVPSEVLERRDVAAWRFEVEDWQRTPQKGPCWFKVRRAEPLS